MVVIIMMMMLMIIVIVVTITVITVELFPKLHFSWTEKHYPHYYKKVRDVVQPASDYVITKLGEGLYYLADVTAPARQYIHENVPPLLEKVCKIWSLLFVDRIE